MYFIQSISIVWRSYMNKMLLFLLCVVSLIISGCSGGNSGTVVIKHEEPAVTKADIRPVNVEASNNHLSQAKVMYVKGKYKQTIDHAEKAIAFNEKNWEAYYYLGLAMQKRRDYQISLEAFNSSLKFSPDNRFVRSEIHSARGYSWEQLGDLENANSEYMAALEFNAENANARQGTNRIKIEKTMKGWGKDAKGKIGG